jgi:hypothetical protein
MQRIVLSWLFYLFKVFDENVMHGCLINCNKFYNRIKIIKRIRNEKKTKITKKEDKMMHSPLHNDFLIRELLSE